MRVGHKRWSMRLDCFEISDENSTFVRQKFRFWLIIKQNFDRYLLWNKKGQFSCLIHLICAMFTTRWRFFENFKWKKANFDTSFKKKLERHGFWRKSYRNENLAIDLLLTFWKFKETAEKREKSHRKARKRQVLSLTKEKMGKKVIQLTEKQENWIYWSLETLINSSKLKYRRNLCWEPLKLTKMDRFWTDFKPFWQKFKKMKPWNLEFFTPNDSDKSKMGSKFGTLQKNFSNFRRRFENRGLIRTFLAEN